MRRIYGERFTERDAVVPKWRLRMVCCHFYTEKRENTAISAIVSIYDYRIYLVRQQDYRIEVMYSSDSISSRLGRSDDRESGTLVRLTFVSIQDRS